MTDTWDLFADVAAITGWLDEQGDLTDEDHLLKVLAEAGEAADALAGWKGKNRRKGVTHTREQFLEECADVVLAMLCAIQHFTQDADGTRALLAAKLQRIIERAGIGVTAQTAVA